MKFTDGREIQYASFNQDNSRLCIGTKDGYHLFNTDPLKHNRTKTGEGTSILEMLFLTSLGAHVGCGETTSMRTLRMINTQREKEITRMNYQTSILTVRLNRERLVVVLESTIYIYDIKNMHLLHTIGSTPKNPKGVCALATGHIPGDLSGATKLHNYLAYPASDDKGDINIYDVANLRAVTMISAHTTPVSCLAISNSGDKLVTASEKGTVFRVYLTNSGTKLAEFRRGLATNASISSMCLSPLASWLAVSSEKQTIHIFKMPHEQPEAKKEDTSTWTGYFKSSVASVTSYLPTTMTELFTQERSFATITIPVAGVQSLVAVTGSEESPVIAVVTSDGIFYQYTFDVHAGGDCQVHTQRQLELRDTAHDAAAAAAGGAPADPPADS